MYKSVAQLTLQPINYDGVHAIPINECVNYSAHGTDLKKRTNAVSFAVAPQRGANLNTGGYSIDNDVESRYLNGFN
ncbi:hypothetical protein BADSM9389_10420 [Buttiauxella agrestis]|nr:hypothetical protein BADSM9389_10420 [Buttiauxella agrestis]